MAKSERPARATGKLKQTPGQADAEATPQLIAGTVVTTMTHLGADGVWHRGNSFLEQPDGKLTPITQLLAESDQRNTRSSTQVDRLEKQLRERRLRRPEFRGLKFTPWLQGVLRSAGRLRDGLTQVCAHNLSNGSAMRPQVADSLQRLADRLDSVAQGGADVRTINSREVHVWMRNDAWVHTM